VTARRPLRLVALLALAGGALAACASAPPGPGLATTAPSGAAEQIPMTLSRPDGPGPFPAVVIMHDCSGLGPRSSGAPDRWARELVRDGYVVLIPDSFGTRGFPSGVCVDASPGRNDVAPYRRVHDAYAALAHLRTLPFVDERRVGVMGGSHGGTTTLATMAEVPGEAPALARDKRAGFAAAVALYPACVNRPGRGRSARESSTGGAIVGASGVYTPAAPLLILIGEKDDWTPAEPCRQLARDAQDAGHPVTIKVYPNAHHSFDSSNPVRYVPTRVNSNSPSGRGATTGGDPAAWADSIREVLGFFGKHLK
jgi:dienelactone hydrolase